MCDVVSVRAGKTYIHVAEVATCAGEKGVPLISIDFLKPWHICTAALLLFGSHLLQLSCEYDTQ